jgi:alginate O-acetyltransferase complex protein AlgI
VLFSTPFFIFGFLPVFFALCWLLPARRALLLAGSLVFYGWGEPLFVGVVIASAVFDWLVGERIARRGSDAKALVTLGVVANLALLVYAKYTVFAVENVNALFGATGWASALPVPQIALPLGVSFIVFEKITYLVDLYRKLAPPAKSLLDYLNYVFLFPKLLAGPIVKYHDIADQLSQPTRRSDDFLEGGIRFLQGLGKKVLIADMLAPIADEAFRLPATALGPADAWLGLICFTLQIYFDFSGYSDMAIGMARMLGFRLRENFNNPYLATSITDFWRRWHISLSSWIKDYLYIPLGGNRVSTLRTYVNLCVCFLLCGLWHGASWNFVIWGAIHGLALVIDRAFWLRIAAHLPKPVNIALTFVGVALAWVFFRCETFTHSLVFFRALGGAAANEANELFLRSDTVAVLAAGALLILAPLLPEAPGGERRIASRLPALAGGIALLLLCAGRMAVSLFQPFLYFRF